MNEGGSLDSPLGESLCWEEESRGWDEEELASEGIVVRRGRFGLRGRDGLMKGKEKIRKQIVVE